MWRLCAAIAAIALATAIYPAATPKPQTQPEARPDPAKWPLVKAFDDPRPWYLLTPTARCVDTSTLGNSAARHPLIFYTDTFADKNATLEKNADETEFEVAYDRDDGVRGLARYFRDRQRCEAVGGPKPPQILRGH